MLSLAAIPSGVRAGDPLFSDISTGALPLAALAANSMDVEMTDVDGDGDLDILVACEFCPNKLLINNGAAVFSDESSARLPQVIHDSEDIAIADYDGDGDADVLFVSEDDQINELYFNNGSGVFSDQTQRLGVTGVSNAVIAVDIDRDDDADILIGNAGANVLLVNDGSGQFSDQSALALPFNNEITQDVEAGDIDGDGDPDIIVGNENGNRLWLNNGQGVFSDVTSSHLPLLTGEESREVDFGDIDGDGDLDLIIANVSFAAGSSSRNRLLRNNGCGVFTDISDQGLPAFNVNTVDADFLDVDNDGDLDLLTATAFDGTFQAFLNNGDGLYTEATSLVLPPTATGNGIDVEAADLDHDGRDELYLAVFGGSDQLLRNSVSVEVINRQNFEGETPVCIANL
ncbi:MAG: hypothetical protein Tsb002_23310 [Wenzhouxiangellaceae bacterium]